MKMGVIEILSKEVDDHVKMILDSLSRQKKYEQTDKDWWHQIARSLLELGHMRLVQNRVDDAKIEFRRGIEIMLKNGRIREDMVPGIRRDWHIPFYAYLAGDKEIAEPFINMWLEQYPPRTTIVKEIGLTEPTYDSYKLLDFFILDDETMVKELMKKIDKYSENVEFDVDGLPDPSRPTAARKFGHAFYMHNIVRGIRNRDAKEICHNIDLWSKLILRYLKRNEPPYPLAWLELVILYDLTLGSGLRPKVVTPFIPKTVIENGYWNKPS